MSTKSKSMIHTASPELEAQVSLIQQTELNDLVEMEPNAPGQEEEEDDDLAAEFADFAESEDLLRKELERLMAAL